MLYREIIAVCSEIHTKHINTLCGQNVEFVSVKPGGTYSDHWTSEVNNGVRRGSIPLEGVRLAPSVKGASVRFSSYLEREQVLQLSPHFVPHSSPLLFASLYLIGHQVQGEYFRCYLQQLAV
jgi:hypothetical protein